MRPLQPNFDAMPIELRARPQWVTWRGWPDRKVPYCAAAVDGKASSTDPATWCDFDQAQTAYEEGGRDRVGFVLDGEGIAGIDLDHCVTNGAPKPEAMRILEDIGCHYIELSPSGAGLHGFGFAPPLAHGRKGVIDGVNVEIYTSARFLTVTGHALRREALIPLDGFAAAVERMAVTHTGAHRSTHGPSLCSPVWGGCPCRLYSGWSGHSQFRTVPTGAVGKGQAAERHAAGAACAGATVA